MYVAWNLFVRHRSPTNAYKLRRATARVKRESKKTKRLTWENFVNSLNPMLDVRTPWTKVKNIITERKSHFPTIIDGNTILDDLIDITEKFAGFWSSIGSDEMFETDRVPRSR